MLDWLIKIDAEEVKERIGQLCLHELDDLPETELVSGRMAETNAWAYGLDSFEVKDFVLGSPTTATIYFELYGDQDPDKMYCGDRIHGVLNVTIQDDGTVESEVDSCEIIRD